MRERLVSRRDEIEQAVSNRVFALADPTEIGDPGYTAGLRDAVSVAIDYALRAVLDSGGREVPIPPALFVQAREAARNGVRLDIVMRRYLAGHTLLGDFILQEAEDTLSTEGLQRVCRAQATLFDRVLLAIAEEYKRHADPHSHSVERAKAERVRALLAGELIDPAELGYAIEGRWHVGAIAIGSGARAALRALANRLDTRLLTLDDDGCTWAWFGTKRKIDTSAILSLPSDSPQDITLALGEVSEGLAGWRLTHRQAKAALAIAKRGVPSVVRYRDVAMLSAVLGDEVLVTYLDRAYLQPLRSDRDGGSSLRQTLRAYFAAERNVSSTAAALGVNRSTVITRMTAISERLGQPVSECAAQLEVALQLDELAAPDASVTNKLSAQERILPTH